MKTINEIIDEIGKLIDDRENELNQDGVDMTNEERHKLIHNVCLHSGHKYQDVIEAIDRRCEEHG
jgi:hypothetical protein